jgi:hypothetical protein
MAENENLRSSIGWSGSGAIDRRSVPTGDGNFRSTWGGGVREAQAPEPPKTERKSKEPPA